MSSLRKIIKTSLFSFLIISSTLTPNKEAIASTESVVPKQENQHLEENTNTDFEKTKHVISNITVLGNKTIPAKAIMNIIPYKLGDYFDPIFSNQLIHRLYKLGYFKNVELRIKPYGENTVDLFIVVEEKKKLKEVIFNGNTQVKTKEIYKKVPFEEIPTIDKAELKKYAKMIQAIYIEKDYHLTKIDYEWIEDKNCVTVVFNIHENKKVLVKQVHFKGNKHISSKKLRSKIFTREDWVFGFMNKAGSYQPDAIEYDKYTLENIYQNNGFLNAKIVDAKVDLNKEAKTINVTYTINEGDQYVISEVNASGNNIIPDKDLVYNSMIRPGQIYSKERLKKGMESIRFLWGKHGYLYADVEPSVEPDEKTKTVKISFYTQLGDKVYLNRVNIIGNKKTRDKVIRRQIVLDEGELLTTDKLEISKTRVELLSYFDPNGGVNYNVRKLDSDTADVDFLLKEIKTGRFQWKLGFGGSGQDMSSPSKSLTAGMEFADKNFMGKGIQVEFNAEGGKESKTFSLTLADPWLFDQHITGILGLFFKRSTYDELRKVKQAPVETLYGGSMGLGYTPKKFDMQLLGEVGLDGIKYSKSPIANITSSSGAQTEYQRILDKRFTQGNTVWFSLVTSQDRRNHSVHASRGHRWTVSSKIGLPVDNLGFFKIEGDGTWYTPLIGENALTLSLHGHFGLVTGVGNSQIPYRELFHIGGPASVRGFNFGQIGPNFLGDSIGAKKAFFLNTELIFPIKKDFSMKGVVFYDGGAGWDTPDANDISSTYLQDNNFNYRHSIGFGIRLTSPTPIQVDFGFKLDRNKKRGEKISEVHLTGYHEF